MKIEIDYNLLKSAIEHLELAQKDNFVYSTDFIINDLQKCLNKKLINRDLLIRFYKHLCNTKDILSINSFSCEREVDSFIKNVNNE
jgi:hypothetical protein